MIDLHTHILSGLDDGSREMDDSLALADLALEGGVDRLVATPHSNQLGRFENFYSHDLARHFRRFQSALEEAGIPLTVYLGMEIFASDDMEEKIRDGALISLNHSRYYLVEFEFDEEPGRIGDYLEQIFAVGGVPLIAHPERYHCVQDYPVLAYEWLRMGCCTQINKGSLFGRFGRHAARTAQVMLENQLVTCVASDAHSPYMRTTYMADARDYLAGQFGEHEMRRLMVDNPMRVIRNEEVPRHGRPPERRRSFF